MKLSIAEDPQPGPDHFCIFFSKIIIYAEGRFGVFDFWSKKEPELLINGGSSLFASLVKLYKPNTNEYFMDLGDDDNPSKQERSAAPYII